MLDIITSLNTFEKILVRRPKTFQTLVKMGTVINKKLPERQKVKGGTFYLSLPLQETWNKCKNTDPINHEMYILVRDIPTKKSKIIWEIVDVKKIFDALTW